jgi:hypothetical protein
MSEEVVMLMLLDVTTYPRSGYSRYQIIEAGESATLPSETREADTKAGIAWSG